MALLLPKLVMRSDLQLLLREMEKPAQQPGQGSLALLVQAKRETRRELLQGNLLAAADWRPPLLAAQEAAGLVPPLGGAAGAAAPAGAGLACSAGARAPMFAMS